MTETTIGFSGGGFSNTFARPAYQDTAVSRYLQILGNTNAGLFKYILIPVLLRCRCELTIDDIAPLAALTPISLLKPTASKSS